MDELISNIVFIILAVGISAVGKIFKSIKAKEKSQGPLLSDEDKELFDEVFAEDEEFAEEDDEEYEEYDDDDEEYDEEPEEPVVERVEQPKLSDQVQRHASEPSPLGQLTFISDNSHFAEHKHVNANVNVADTNVRHSVHKTEDANQSTVESDVESSISLDFSSTDDVKRAFVASEIFNRKYF